MLRSAISRSIPRKPHAQMRCWLSIPACSPRPWFIDEEPTSAKSNVTPPIVDDSPISSSRGMDVVSAASLPPDLPTHLLNLHAELAKSPLLEPGRLEIRPPLYTPPGPPLPSALPRGRRRRGGTDVGTGVPEPEGGLWRWIVLAQVKEGSEGSGAIESVMRVVRRTLLKADTPIPLPPNHKRRVEDGWGMLDAGDFAVHVLSRTARQQYFPERSRSWVW